MRRLSLLFFALATATTLSGCDYLGIEPASAIAAQRDAEGRAIGAGCRDAGRAIEDCYTMNKRAEKSSIFAGWRDMNDYMRDNKMDVVPPQAAAGSSAPDEKNLAKKAAKSSSDTADSGSKSS
ncbi:MAG: hypothetical protein KGL43_23540 [Burkholderiales bacterium]|nr:hypothetical protein [Burkholderiales bacterium]